jgi:hypothetical protein
MNVTTRRIIWRLMNYEMDRMRRKGSLPICRCCPWICLEVLGNTTETPSQDNGSPGRHLKPVPPECKARVLPTLVHYTKQWTDLLRSLCVVSRSVWTKRRVLSNHLHKHSSAILLEPLLNVSSGNIFNFNYRDVRFDSRQRHCPNRGFSCFSSVQWSKVKETTID